MSVFSRLFSGLPGGLTAAEYRLYDGAMTPLSGWTSVAVTLARTLSVGQAEYTAFVPVPSGFTTGYLAYRAPGDAATESYADPVSAMNGLPTGDPSGFSPLAPIESGTYAGLTEIRVGESRQCLVGTLTAAQAAGLAGTPTLVIRKAY